MASLDSSLTSLATEGSVTKSRKTVTILRSQPSSPEPTNKASKKQIVVARPVSDDEDFTSTLYEATSTQSLRRDPQGRALERPMLSADDEQQPAEPAPARQASHRALSFARPPTLSNLPEADEGGGDALESHRSSVARLRAAEERLRHAQAMREAETLKKDQVLKNMLPHDRLKIQREERVRARWTETQQTWSRFRTRAAKKLGRDESQLVVAHAEEFRTQVEEYDLVDKARPADQRKSSQWETNLRGGGTRYILIGNIFSGLYCPVRDDVKPIRQIIRRPRAVRQHFGRKTKADDDDEDAELTSSPSRAWKEGKHLQARKQELQKHIKNVRHHEVSHDKSHDLVARGVNLFKWARRSASMLGQIQAATAAVPQVTGPPQTEEAVLALSAVHMDLMRGPWLKLQVSSDAATAPGQPGASLSPDGECAADGSALPASEDLGGATAGLGLSAARGWPRLAFEAPTSSDYHSVLTLTNVGTTALYYTWARVDRGGPAPIETQGATVESSTPRELSRFVCANLSGSVLPGRKVDFTFTFSSPNPGVFRESWQLSTVPAANQGRQFRIALRGVATAVDEVAPLRQQLEARLALHAGERAAEEEAERNRPRTPPPPPTELEQQDIHRKLFESLNPGLLYSPEVFAGFEQLASSVYTQLKFPEQDRVWDANVSALETAINLVTAPPETAAEKEARLKAAAEAAERAKAEEAARKAAEAKKPAAKAAAGKKVSPRASTPAAAAPPPELTEREKLDMWRRNAKARLAELVAVASAPAPSRSAAFPVVRALLCELVESIPRIVGAARLAAGLPLRESHGDQDLNPAVDSPSLMLFIKGKPPKPKKMRINSDDEEETDTEAEESEDESEEEESDAEPEDEDDEPKEVLPREAPPPPTAEPSVRVDFVVRSALRGLLGDAIANASGQLLEQEVAVRAAMQSMSNMDLSSKLGLRDVDVAGKVVLLRTDLDVPLHVVVDPAVALARRKVAKRAALGRRPKVYPVLAAADAVPPQWAVSDPSKLGAALPSIQFLVHAKAAVVLLASHVGSSHLPYAHTPDGSAPEICADVPASTAPIADALSSMLGRPVPVCALSATRGASFADRPAPNIGVGVNPELVDICTAARMASGSLSRAETKIVLLENVLVSAEELADVTAFGLTGRRRDLAHSSGHLFLDTTDVRLWGSAHVSVWLHRLCPGIARRTCFDLYVADWAAKEINGAKLLKLSPRMLACFGILDADVPVLAGALLAVHERAQAEDAARRRVTVPDVLAVPAAAAAASKPFVIAEGADDEEEGEEPELASDPAAAAPLAVTFLRTRDIAEERLVATAAAAVRVTAFRAGLSRLVDVFVNDCLGYSHCPASSIVGIAPRPALIARLEVEGISIGKSVFAQQEAVAPVSSGATSTQSAAGLRLAGLRLSAELEAFLPILQPQLSRLPKKFLVIGGADVLRKAPAVANLLNLVDEVAVGGVFGVLWSHVASGSPVGALETLLGQSVFAQSVCAVRRLAGHAARRGVRVHLPRDAVTGTQPFVRKLEAEEEEDDELTESEEEDSDTERKRLRREKRAAKKAAAAAPASQPAEDAPVAEPVIQNEPVRPATAMLPSIPDEQWSGLGSGVYDSAQEYEYDGDVREVPVASIPITSHVLDVGSDTREAWTERAGVLARAGVTVILYGPLGVVETPDGAGGTREFLDGLVALKSSSPSKVAVIAAGGSLSVWASAFGHASSLDCVCNGGAGLSLLLAGATVPGVAVLSDGK